MTAYHLILATPEQVLFEGDVLSLIAPGSEGYLEILANHAPIITSLMAGTVTITDKGHKKTTYPISGGLLEAAKNQASLLADSVLA
jgi:F-type H+-transporting ATPase subunit epsilon